MNLLKLAKTVHEKYEVRIFKDAANVAQATAKAARKVISKAKRDVLFLLMAHDRAENMHL